MRSSPHGRLMLQSHQSGRNSIGVARGHPVIRPPRFVEGRACLHRAEAQRAAGQQKLTTAQKENLKASTHNAARDGTVAQGC